MHTKKMMLGGVVAQYENVKYVLRDKDGNIKPLFKDWALNRIFLRFIRAQYSPYDASGELKKGSLGEIALTYLALYGIRIPLITGVWVGSMQVKNLITSAGKAGIASRINGAGSEAAFTYIAVGTGTTAAAAGDTTLETESAASGLSRANATASRVTTSVTNDTAQLVNTFSVSGTVAVTESGVLNAASSGTLLCRQTFSAINVVNGDSLQITWKVQSS